MLDVVSTVVVDSLDFSFPGTRLVKSWILLNLKTSLMQTYSYNFEIIDNYQMNTVILKNVQLFNIYQQANLALLQTLESTW